MEYVAELTRILSNINVLQEQIYIQLLNMLYSNAITMTSIFCSNDYLLFPITTDEYMSI